MDPPSVEQPVMRMSVISIHVRYAGSSQPADAYQRARRRETSCEVGGQSALTWTTHLVPVSALGHAARGRAGVGVRAGWWRRARRRVMTVVIAQVTMARWWSGRRS